MGWLSVVSRTPPSVIFAYLGEPSMGQSQFSSRKWLSGSGQTHAALATHDTSSVVKRLLQQPLILGEHVARVKHAHADAVHTPVVGLRIAAGVPVQSKDLSGQVARCELVPSVVKPHATECTPDCCAGVTLEAMSHAALESHAGHRRGEDREPKRAVLVLGPELRLNVVQLVAQLGLGGLGRDRAVALLQPRELLPVGEDVVHQPALLVHGHVRRRRRRSGHGQAPLLCGSRRGLGYRLGGGRGRSGFALADGLARHAGHEQRIFLNVGH
eukprot:scaffold15944_cov115-Isochrysis_galbana.AAC.6